MSAASLSEDPRNAERPLPVGHRRKTKAEIAKQIDRISTKLGQRAVTAGIADRPEIFRFPGGRDGGPSGPNNLSFDAGEFSIYQKVLPFSRHTHMYKTTEVEGDPIYGDYKYTNIAISSVNRGIFRGFRSATADGNRRDLSKQEIITESAHILMGLHESVVLAERSNELIRALDIPDPEQ